MRNMESETRQEINLSIDGLTAVINTDGAFVESIVDSSGNDLIFPRQDIEGKDRGGIPVCAVTFGPSEKAGLAQHAYARKQSWEDITTDEDRETNIVRLALGNPREQDPTIPEKFAGCEMELSICLSKEGVVSALDMLLEVRNQGNQVFPSAPGFHPYFRIPEGMSAADIEIHKGDDAYSYNAQELKDSQVITPGKPNFVEMFIGDKKVTVRSPELNTYVVWSANPEQYICVEPTDLGAFDKIPETAYESLDVAPGSRKFYGMRIEIEPINQ